MGLYQEPRDRVQEPFVQEGLNHRRPAPHIVSPEREVSAGTRGGGGGGVGAGDWGEEKEFIGHRGRAGSTKVKGRINSGL